MDNRRNNFRISSVMFLVVCTISLAYVAHCKTPEEWDLIFALPDSVDLDSEDPKDATECSFQGAIYVNTQRWEVDECSRCYCTNGTINCLYETCPPLNCDASEQVKIEGQCCKKCPPDPEDPQDATECFFQGAIYAHTQRWEVDECSRCYCTNGTINCVYETCPQLNCDFFEQVKIEGQCCKKCPPVMYISSGRSASTTERRFHDCRQYYNEGARLNNVYTIHPSQSVDPFNVYCDFNTTGRGWTVIQRRFVGHTLFYRNWETYKKGFGPLAFDHWLGLDNIYALAASKRSKLRIDLYDCAGSHRFAEYDYFALGEELTNYELLLGNYNGDAGDSLSEHRYKPFSTFDNDNDESTANCANAYKGAWWYNSCNANTSCLNGLYFDCDNVPPGHTGITWSAWKGNAYSIGHVEMKIISL